MRLGAAVLRAFARPQARPCPARTPQKVEANGAMGLLRSRAMGDKRGNRRPGHTRLSTKNQVTVPRVVTDAVGAAAGTGFRVEADDAGRIVLTPVAAAPDARRAAVARVAGSMPGIWPQGEFAAVREEWL